MGIHYAHFTDKNTEAQRDCKASPNHRDDERYSQTLIITLRPQKNALYPYAGLLVIQKTNNSQEIIMISDQQFSKRRARRSI